MTRRLRWGVIGTAGINDRVVPAIQGSQHGELVAIASRTTDRARAQAARFGIPRAYAPYDDLLADQDVEAVHLVLPNHLHREWTLRALAAGKHVLCEKPMALDAAQAQEMVGAAADAGRVLVEGFMYGHHPRYDRAADVLRSGRIGPVRGVTATFTFDASDEAGITAFRGHPGGGATYDVGCYGVHAVRHLLGREPAAVTAVSQWSDTHGGIDMMTSALLEVGDVGALVQCGMWTADKDEVVVLGQHGSLEIPSAFFATPGHDEVVVRTADGVETIRTDPVDHFSCQADDFALAVLQGRPTRYPRDEPVAGAAVLASILASARSRTRVAVPTTSPSGHETDGSGEGH